jgi:hypothetical protein
MESGGNLFLLTPLLSLLMDILDHIRAEARQLEKQSHWLREKGQKVVQQSLQVISEYFQHAGEPPRKKRCKLIHPQDL